MSKSQSISPIPLELLKKRKTSVNIKNHLKRKAIKIPLDFNSQLFTNENNNDFNSIVNSLQKFVEDEPKNHKSLYNQQTFAFQSPLKIVKYRPNNKYKRVRYSTELNHFSSPKTPNLHLRQNQSHLSEQEQFKRFQSQSKQIKMRLNYLFPHIKQRKSDKFAETVNYMQIIKPWQTKRDVFHETFKRYIAQNSRFIGDDNRYTKWIKYDSFKTKQ